MTTNSDFAALGASTWQLHGASAGTFTLHIAADKVTGMGGCNRYFGGITEQGDGILTLSPLGATRMMCEGALADQEMNYLVTLGKVATFRIEERQLILADADEKPLLTFDALPAQQQAQK